MSGTVQLSLRPYAAETYQDTRTGAAVVGYHVDSKADAVIIHIILTTSGLSSTKTATLYTSCGRVDRCFNWISKFHP